MKRRLNKFLLMALTGVLFLFSCSNPVTSSEDDGDILLESFFLNTTLNPALSSIVMGEIENYEVILVISTDSSLSYYVPEFVSSAQSVLVDGQEQVSGESGQDFSNPVDYTFISSSGKTTVYTVEAIFLGFWNEMDGSPVGTAVGTAAQVKIDLKQGVFPHLIYMDNALLLSGKYYDAYNNPYWVNMGGPFGSANILSFSSQSTDSSIWTAAVSSGSPNAVSLIKYQDPGNWTAMGLPVFLDGPDLGNLKVFAENDFAAYISVIDSYGSSNQPEVWSYNGIWNHHGGGPLSSMSASSFVADLIDGQLIAAASYNDDPDNIYLYYYDWDFDIWYPSTIAKPGHLVRELYRDEETNDLIMVTVSVNSNDSSLSDVNWLSWDMDSNSVSDYVEPLTLYINPTDPLALYFSDNTPLLATDQYVYEYIKGGWRTLGNGPYCDTPSLAFSIVASSLGSRFIAYQDSGSYDVIVKMLKLE
ncbi:MAG: hypothetical protein B6241_01645 [Spirochaetaceae bacterium 4572_59]|nr:MAG: hypothetical protein B6241_01645 [Spirochaetaceae bacterium 4572_59]